jgi:hypothetical protein
MPTSKESIRHQSQPTAGASKPLSRPERDRAARERWKGAARRFKGLDIRLNARQELRYIFLTKWGYQVRIHRAGKHAFTRSVRGFSAKSLQAAMLLRDEAMREMPTKRLHAIPPKVLHALGLSSAVLGISRWPPRSVYRVFYRDAAGKPRLRQFYYRQVPEEDAYAAAIAFLQKTLK